MNHFGTHLFLLLIWCGLSINHAGADQRELGSEGDTVRISIDSAYRCSDKADIRIDAASVSYFDTGAAVIQNLSDNARAVLGFECPSIQEIYYTGYTGDIEVFSADTRAEVNWVLQSAPATLEVFALFFSLRDPSLLNLGALYALQDPYAQLPELEESYQYEFYLRQLKRMAESADAQSFAAHLDDLGVDLGTFRNAKAHFESVLAAVELVRLELADPFSLEYFTRLGDLKDAYWSAQVSSVLDDSTLDYTQILERAGVIAGEADSDEFTAFFDREIAVAFRSEAEFYSATISEASPDELAEAATFLVSLPEDDYSATFPASAALIGLLPDQLVTAVEARRLALVDLAQQGIAFSGGSYTDVDPIIDYGFAVADEFEQAGYPQEARSLLDFTLDRVGQVLRDDLPNFNEQLVSLELDDESTTALQEKALIFRELSEQFPEYGEYVRTIEDKLVTDRRSICESILVKADVKKAWYSAAVELEEESMSLSDMACVRSLRQCTPAHRI